MNGKGELSIFCHERSHVLPLLFRKYDCILPLILEALLETPF